jgi:hypothetical protein
MFMTLIRNRLLGLALAPVVGAALVIGCAACGTKSKPGVASAAGQNGGPAASGAARATSWAAYDKKEEEYAACLRDHGLPNVRYTGHKDSATSPDDEMSGIPADANKVVYPAFEKCTVKGPGRGDRPEPFAEYTMPAAELEQQRAVARCVREHGFPDYPDPDPHPGPGSPNKYSNNKAGQNPKLDEAFKTCRRQLGIPEPTGGVG